MKLPEVLAALKEEMPTRAEWRIAILSRSKSESSTTGVMEWPVFDVAVDHADKEINLLTDEQSKRPRPPSEGMTLEQLLNRLQKLRAKCHGYSVYSGSAYVSLDAEFEGRLDCPLVGVARNQEAGVYGFLQWPREQWETTE